MLNYFRNKQARILQAVPEGFVRERYMAKLMSDNKLVGVIGPRGVGKTTLMLQYLKKNFRINEFLYFSADDVYIADTKLVDIADEFVRYGGVVLAVDEIHKYGNWVQEVKNIYDSFPNLKVRFSGSSMLNLMYQGYDLSRRCVTVSMDTLSFHEYLGIKRGLRLSEYSFEDILASGYEISQDIALARTNLYSDFIDYLKQGAYPFFIEDTDTYKNKLFNALQKVINEDIPSCRSIDFTQIVIFKKLIARLIEAGLPYKINVAKLASEFGVSQPTLSSYLDMLKDTKIFRPIKKYSHKVSRKPAKILFDNTSILHTYADEFGVEVNSGTARETFFASCFSDIWYSDAGDFRVKDVVFEIGGRGKSSKQIEGLDKAFLVIDTDYTTDPKRIPLWVFGMMAKP